MQYFHQSSIPLDCSDLAFIVLDVPSGGGKLELVACRAGTDTAMKEPLYVCETFKQRYHTFFDAAADAMMVVSQRGALLDLNARVCEHVKKRREELLGKPAQTLFTPAWRQYVSANFEALVKQGGQRGFEAQLMRPGSPIPVEINARLIEFQGSLAVIGIARDITERKILQARLEYQASTDSLTGLNNRRSFMFKAEQEFQRARRYGASFAILMLDLDFFKKINDSWGHQTGDALLRDFAGRMQAAFRRLDIIGRVGGEEFCALLLESGIERAMEAAERLRWQVEKSPFQVNGLTVPYTVSIGAAVAGPDDVDTEAVIRRADAALYRAKRNGRNQVEFKNFQTSRRE